MASLKEILSWFEKNKYPTQEQFKESWTSFWHKSEKLPQTQVLGLNNVLDKKVNRDEVKDMQAGILFQDAKVDTPADLPIAPNKLPNGDVPEHLWGVYVESEGHYYQYNAEIKKWSKTPYSEMPSNILGTEDSTAVVFKRIITDSKNAKFLNTHIKELRLKNFDESNRYVVAFIRNLETLEVNIGVYKLNKDDTLNLDYYVTKRKHHDGTKKILTDFTARSKGKDINSDADFDIVLDIEEMPIGEIMLNRTDTEINPLCHDARFSPVSNSGNNIEFVGEETAEIIVNGLPSEPVRWNKAFDTTSTITDDTRFNITDFYRVSKGGLITLSGIPDMYGKFKFSQLIGLYDENKAPLGFRLGASAVCYEDKRFLYELPEMCKYIATYHSHNSLTGDGFAEKYNCKIVYGDTTGEVSAFKVYNDILDKEKKQFVPIKEMKATLDTHATDIEALKMGGGSGGDPIYLPRPNNGIVNFQVDVDTYIADIESQTLNNQDLPTTERPTYIKKDWCILMLPTNYVRSGKPIRLIITCHGTGTWINGSSTTSSGTPSYLLSQGYAVLDVNGVPGGGTTDTGARHYGSPIALRSYLAAYNYVVNNYNLKKDGCFVFGISMGGLSSMLLCLSGSIPVLAQGGFCPCIDVWKQAFVNPWAGAGQRKSICEQYGFTGVAPTFTTQLPPTQAETDYFMSNIDKVVGYNSMWKNIIGLDLAELMGSTPAKCAQFDASEQAIFDKYCKIHTVPIKLWHNLDDSIVRYRYSKYYIEMCRRAGCLAELRTFPSGGHNAWSNGEVVTNIPTITGGVTSVSTSFYELLEWFRRFE